MKNDTYSPSGEDIYDKSLNLIRESVKDILQEILITLPDETTHIVYVNSVRYSDTDKGIVIEFSTPSTNRKNELYAHVENCIKLQIEEEVKKYYPKNWSVKKIKELLW